MAESSRMKSLFTRVRYHHYFRFFYPSAITRIPIAGQKTLYLTFDDGPHPENTPHILQLLSKWRIKATFFVTGTSVQQHPDLLRDVAGQGHVVGNHTYSHRAILLSNGRFEQEIQSVNELLRQILGKRVRLFRPPYGRIFPWNLRVLQKYGLQLVLWDILSPDYFPSDGKRPFPIKLVRNGSIIVCHDGSPHASDYLSRLEHFIHTAVKSGYHFRPVPETVKKKVEMRWHSI